MISVDLMSLWKFVCSVLLCSSVRKRKHLRVVDRFFSHRAHRVHWAFLRTISNPQNASGIQSSQSVKTIVDTNKGQHEAYIHSIGESRWSLPFPPGEGTGEGPLSFCPLCVLFICVNLWEYNAPTRWDKAYETRWGVPSFTKDISFSHRTHRFNRPFLRTVSNSQNASGIQNSQNVITKDGCKVLWNRLT